MIASWAGHVAVVKVLLENDAQVNLQDDNGQSSLMVASDKSHVDMWLSCFLNMKHRLIYKVVVNGLL